MIREKKKSNQNLKTSCFISVLIKIVFFTDSFSLACIFSLHVRQCVNIMLETYLYFPKNSQNSVHQNPSP